MPLPVVWNFLHSLLSEVSKSAQMQPGPARQISYFVASPRDCQFRVTVIFRSLPVPVRPSAREVR